MHPLALARLVISFLCAPLVALSLCLVASYGAFARITGAVLRAESRLAILVRVAAMQADYGKAVAVSTDRECQGERELAWLVEAAKASDGFPLDPARLCKLAVRSHYDEDARIMSVQARTGASCDTFRASLKSLVSALPGGREFTSISQDGMRTELSSVFVRQARQYYLVKDYSVLCSEAGYSVRFPVRGFFSKP
ncbi:hypothetical protein AB4099_08905 [Bosea sp. 2KB_26]|uniref:hypothetical protein n=1 Tax=Bosea sp. 2KB_26 TaxID=3237475 RepID=UPI0013AFF3D2